MKTYKSTLRLKTQTSRFKVSFLSAIVLGLSFSNAQAEESGVDPVSGVEWKTDNNGDGEGGEENTSNGNRQPVSIVQRSRTNTVYNGVSTGDGRSYWGHLTKYGLKVVDNQNNPYGLGRPRESFSNTQSYNPSGVNWNPGAASTWPKGALFTDNNMAVVSRNVGLGVLWYKFDQSWSIVEIGKTWSNIDTHGVAHYQDYATRSGAN